MSAYRFDVSMTYGGAVIVQECKALSRIQALEARKYLTNSGCRGPTNCKRTFSSGFVLRTYVERLPSSSQDDMSHAIVWYLSR